MENLLLNRAERLVVWQWPPCPWFTPCPLVCGGLRLDLCMGMLSSLSLRYLYWALQISCLASPLPPRPAKTASTEGMLRNSSVAKGRDWISHPATTSAVPQGPWWMELPGLSSIYWHRAACSCWPSRGEAFLQCPHAEWLRVAASVRLQSVLPCVECRQG